jgi:hypothetical protein
VNEDVIDLNSVDILVIDCDMVNEDVGSLSIVAILDVI